VTRLLPLEREFDDAEKTHESELRYERRGREDKDSALRSALDDLSRTQSLLSQRESDLEAVQNALREMEQRSKELGETHTTRGGQDACMGHFLSFTMHSPHRALFLSFLLTEEG
jgi:hypothetical protein